jgi:hypothetical protein
MKEEESRLQEIKLKLDKSNARLYDFSNDLYLQTSNLCGEFPRLINELPSKEVGDFYLNIFQGQILFQKHITADIENTLSYLKSATNKI